MFPFALIRCVHGLGWFTRTVNVDGPTSVRQWFSNAFKRFVFGFCFDTRPTGREVTPTTEQPVTILVVDDNPNHRKISRSRLESGGYSVVEVSSGREALAAIEKTRFALMTLDLSMPDMDGFDVLDRLLPTPEAASTTLIFEGPQFTTGR